MKKTKMLVPSLSLVALATTVPMVVTSCTKKNEDDGKVVNVELEWNLDKYFMESEEMVFDLGKKYCAIVDLRKWGPKIEETEYYRWKMNVVPAVGSAFPIQGEFGDVILNDNVLTKGEDKDYTIDRSSGLEVISTQYSINSRENKFEIYFTVTEPRTDKAEIIFDLESN